MVLCATALQEHCRWRTVDQTQMAHSSSSAQRRLIGEQVVWLLLECSGFPVKPGLAALLSAFVLWMFLKSTILLGISGRGFLWVICPSCHPANSVKALTSAWEKHRLFRLLFIHHWTSNGRKRCCCLYASCPTMCQLYASTYLLK